MDLYLLKLKDKQFLFRLVYAKMKLLCLSQENNTLHAYEIHDEDFCKKKNVRFIFSFKDMVLENMCFKNVYILYSNIQRYAKDSCIQ